MTTAALPTSTNSPPSAPSIAFADAKTDEPLAPRFSARECPAPFEGAVAQRFELSSRGDRVLGRLLLPSSRTGPCPLVLALGAKGRGCESAEFDFLAAQVRDGFALATIDLSLFGERRSAKFSERLISAIKDTNRARDLDPNGQMLLVEYTRQSIADVTRTLDTLSSLPAVNDNLVAIIGVGHGAALAAIASSVDQRIKATVLADCGSVGIPEIDPRRYVRAIHPRSVLVVDAAETREASSIYQACAEPKKRHIADKMDVILAGDGAQSALDFLVGQLSDLNVNSTAEC